MQKRSLEGPLSFRIREAFLPLYREYHIIYHFVNTYLKIPKMGIFWYNKIDLKITIKL